MDRLEIKEALKDLKAQYKADIEICNMYLKDFRYCGDDIIASDKQYFSGNITTKNLKEARIDTRDIVKKQILDKGIQFNFDSEEITCDVKVRIIDKWDNIEDYYITIERISL